MVTRCGLASVFGLLDLKGKPPAWSSTLGRRLASVVGAHQDYIARLRAWIERHKRYPRRARLLRREGTVVLHLVLGRDGSVRASAIKESSGHRLLDRAVRDLVEDASPFPAFPDTLPQDQLSLNIPIVFALR